MSISSATPGAAAPIAVIGGSGFGQAFLSGNTEIVETPYGAAAITRGTHNGRDIVFLARHGDGHTIAPHRINHRANIAAIKEIGGSMVLATAAVGSLRTDMGPGEFVILSDFIDMTKGDAATFYEEGDAVVHCDFSQPYDPDLRGRLTWAAEECLTALGPAVVHPAGTYVCVSGPRYETPAEVRAYAAWGGDVVGMTSAPEAILCREAGLRYASIATITNYACGLISSAGLSHEEVIEQMEISRSFLVDVMMHVINHAEIR